MIVAIAIITASASCRRAPYAKNEAKQADFPVDAVAEYSVRYADRSLSDLRPLLGQPDAPPAPGMAHTFRTEIEGRLYVKVTSPRGISLWLKPDRVQFEADGDVDAATADRLGQELRLGAAFAFDENGLLVTTTVPPGLGRITMGLWQAIGTRFQWRRPSGSETRWEGQEPDVNGRLTARYEAIPKGAAGLRVVRRRVHLDIEPDQGAEDAVTAGESLFEFESMHALPQRMACDDRTELRRMERPIGVSQSRLSLVLTSTKEKEIRDAIESLASLAKPKGKGFVMRDGQVPVQAFRAELERARLAGRTPEAIWKAFEVQAAKQSGARDAFLSLKALFYLQPDQCQIAARRLIRTGPKGPEFEPIVEALADAGHEAAQKALLNVLMSFEASRKPIHGVVGAMGGLNDPGPSTIAALKAVVDRDASGADSALLSLGRLAHPKGKPAEYDPEPLVRYLIAVFAAAGSEDRRAIACLALGNTASPVAEPTILEASRDSDADLRCAAATSLRWMPGASAGLRLRALLASDDSATVRQHAASALSFQPTVESRKALIGAMADRVAAVRLSVLMALTHWPSDDAEIRACYERAASDPDEDVRRLAQSLLRGGT